MKLLALDTAGSRCSVALMLGEELQELDVPAERLQAERVLPMVEQLLGGAGLTLKALDAIAFGRGPGAFTGLRVAASMAQGLAFGAGIPVVPVSDLAALAAAAARVHRAERIMACLDARMHEVYWAAYEARPDGLVALGEEALSPPSDVAAPSAGPWFGAGPGWGAYGDALKVRIPELTGTDPALLPTAGDVARLGQAALRKGGSMPPERGLPVYLRDKVATPKA